MAGVSMASGSGYDALKYDQSTERLATRRFTDHEHALTLLQESEKLREPFFLYYFINDPVFDSIRGDPRYIQMRDNLQSRLH